MTKRPDPLLYHARPPAGKIEVRPTKPCSTQADLSLAYTPGVAEPCLEIYADPEKVFDYTARGNLVAVVTNGTAVLGLGNIGPAAAKPVMEGKAVLFKQFAGIDVFDIELDAPGVDEFCQAVRAMAPTFGGINLEDIKAPDCFLIEERLRAELDIPVFHDDQHGTAIIICAGLVNASMIAGKRMEDLKVVFSGAGAAALATARLVQCLGVARANILLCDSKGVVYRGAPGLEQNPYKAQFAADTDLRTLTEALRGADAFIGVSVKDVVSPDMLLGMAPTPIVFALANPDPEIPYLAARAARPDAIVATGRSDFPNQVNNVLGFPFIFRGALDARVRFVNEPMMIAAVHALAEIAREEVVDVVSQAYGDQRLQFGPEYIIPKPFDPRALLRVAPAVAKAATESGVARRPIDDIDAYRNRLERLLGKEREIFRFAVGRAQQRASRIVLADGENEKALRAASRLIEENIAQPVLVGREAEIRGRAEQLELRLRFGPDACEIIDTQTSDLRPDFEQTLFDRRCRKGMTLDEARRRMRTRNWFASMLVREGHADGLVAGLGGSFPETLRPIIHVIGMSAGVSRVAGVHLMVMRNELFFFADTTLMASPTAEEVAETACLTAELARRFGITPRIAMLSFSNFGSVSADSPTKMRRAAEIVGRRCPDLEVEGEIHADVALMPDHCAQRYPFSRLSGKANVLIFPSLDSGNIAQKIAQCAGAEASIGPVLVGVDRPANIVAPYATASEITMNAAITAMLAAGDAVDPARILALNKSHLSGVQAVPS